MPKRKSSVENLVGSQSIYDHFSDELNKYIDNNALSSLIGKNCQIGFTCDVNYLTNNLRSYSLYGKKRWQSARARDLISANTLNTQNNRMIVPVIAFDYFLFQDLLLDSGIIKNVFGISNQEYKDFIQQLRLIDNKRTYPEYLESECRAILNKRSKLRKFRNKEFNYKTNEARDYINSTNIVVTASGVIERHLNRFNYIGRQGRAGLSVGTRNEFEYEVSSRLLDIVDSNLCTNISIALPEENEWPKTGRFFFKDIGAEAVVEQDFRVIEGLSHDLNVEYSKISAHPVCRAWSLINPLIDWQKSVDDELFRQYEIDIKEVSYEKDRLSVFETDKALNEFMDIDDDKTIIHILTGAAGMGKTYKAAEIIFRLLNKYAHREWPPFRVLAVAYSNKAVDTLFEELNKKAESYTIYRQYTEKQKNEIINSDQVSECMIKYMHNVSENILSKIAEIKIEDNLNNYYEMHKKEVDELASHLNESEQTCIKRKLFIPSHEKWRAEVAKIGAIRIENEIEYIKNIIKTKKEKFEHFVKKLCGKSFGTTKQSSRAYELFAADVVMTTVDSALRMPDMLFDYVIFEEASQINVIQTLKVLAYVIRARGENLSPPKILFTGDTKQLPPFAEYTTDNKYHPIKIPNSILDRLIYSDIASRTTLFKQRRMKTEIATLINTIFYNNEKWISVDETKEKGIVIWVDTSTTNGTEKQKKGSTSWFNEVEVKIVAKLLEDSDIKSDNDIIIVSAYADQIKLMTDKLGDRAKMIKTIDSCQGTTASTVIVSIVAFRDFVKDARRLNVALSRARKQLYIVGNLKDLYNIECNEKHPHLLGLKTMFAGSESNRFKIINGQKLIHDR